MARKGAKRRRAKGAAFPWLRHDPIPWLLSAEDEAITTFVGRDLLGQRVDIKALWELREPRRIVARQQADGRWCYPTRKPPPFNYDLYETFNTLGVLVDKCGLDKRHPAIERAAAYVFSCQAAEGDYRGIYGNQPAHTYTPALMEVLIRAGYGSHRSIERAFQWLLETRQDDGGWAIPARTRDKRLVKDWLAVAQGPPIEADRSRPFSHLVTGMVLRAFAVHPRRRRLRAAKDGTDLLKSRLFKSDKYADRRGTEYWTKFTYPFGFTDLLTALDSFGRMGQTADDPDVARVIAWFRKRQRSDGSFDLIMRRGVGDQRLDRWLGLAICRALLRFEPDR
ncbi:MAG: hypothetical protein JRI68_28350 [Deltaproteobacteria bacterium]|nr:hypothetical protein [Deltaproteobacteria bacterium]